MPRVDDRTRTTTAVGPGSARISLSEAPWTPPAVAIIAIGLVAVFAFVVPDYAVFVSTSIAFTMVALLGLGIVTGTAGMIALCQLSFAAISAWVLSFLMLRTDLPEWLGGVAWPIAMIVGALVAAVFGVIVGLPALRLRGVNLAVITLGIAAALDTTLGIVFFPSEWTNVQVPRPFSIVYGGVGDREYLVFAAVVVGLVAIGVHYLQHSRWGSSWRAVAYSERGTAAAGINVRTAKLSAFAASAFVAGIAGALLVGQITQVSKVNFAPAASLALYVLTLMLGASDIAMAFIGGLLSVLLPEILKLFGVPLDWPNLIFGVLGIQALTTNSNMGNDLRRLLQRLRPGGRGAGSAQLAALPLLGGDAPAPADDVVLTVEHLGVQFGALRALDDVNLTLHKGEILGLIGPNGAGKSTFVDALTGFLPHHTGEIRLGDRTIDRLSPHQIARAGLRRTFQQARVPTTMTVGAYVRLMVPGRVDPARIDEALAYFGAPDRRTPLDTVDVGTRRIIEVAASIAARPQVLLLDEPAAGLSHDEHLALADRLRNIPQRFGVTIVLIEHDLDLVRSVCTNLVVLNFGEVLATGPQEEVLATREVLAAYMGETELL